MSKKKSEKQTLTNFLIELIDTKAYRAGTLKGYKHPEIKQDLIDRIGKAKLLREARELHEAGIVYVDWIEFGNDIRQIDVAVENMDKLCARAGVPEPRKRQQSLYRQVEAWKQQAEEPFVKKYYQDMQDKLAAGDIPKNVEDKDLALCLIGLPKEGEQEWERVFSRRVLHDSKKFLECKTRFITVLKGSPRVMDGMEDQEILTEHGILTYSQTLEWKGPLKYQIDHGEVVDCAALKYGCILNAQTLEHALPVSLAGIRAIVTIENKANYEALAYDSSILYVYCHGFFSPKERRFLVQLEKLAKDCVSYYHWSDMDYGGIRIYNFIQTRLFPRLRPINMGPEQFEVALRAGAGVEIEKEKYKKLEEIDAGDLSELKQCILDSGMVIEQEALLTGRVSRINLPN